MIPDVVHVEGGVIVFPVKGIAEQYEECFDRDVRGDVDIYEVVRKFGDPQY